MIKKRLYITVEEKEEYKALSKQYGITEHALHSQRIIKPKKRKAATRLDRHGVNLKCEA